MPIFLQPLAIYLVKAIMGWATDKLVAYIGQTETVKHVGSVLEKYTPPAPDPNPSPAQLRNPRPDWLK